MTAFTREGEVDQAAIQRLGSWLGSFDGVKGLVVVGHAGEGTFLTADEPIAVIESFIKSVDGKIAIIAGITLEGSKVAAFEAKRAVKAGARRASSTPRTAGCASAIRRERHKIATAPSTKKAVCR